MFIQGPVEITTTRLNPHVDPTLHAWGWEVPVDLFLAALAAGMAILHATVVLSGRQQRYPSLIRWATLVPPLALGMALGALFLDLEYKLHLFRFFTTFQVTSPMSWGSWLYLLLSISTGLTALATYTRSEPIPLKRLAWANLVLGVGLVIYTGVLLSSVQARPAWNSPVLLPLFLVTGLLSALALAGFWSRNRTERRSFAAATLVLLAAEAVLVLFYCVHLATSGASGSEALALIMGGPYTAAFWSLVVVAGILLPALLEMQTWRQRWPATAVAPALILVGGLALRFVLVQAGQHLSV